MCKIKATLLELEYGLLTRQMKRICVLIILEIAALTKAKVAVLLISGLFSCTPSSEFVILDSILELWVQPIDI